MSVSGPEQPQVDEIDGIFVVRDDLFPGGTKARVLPRLFRKGVEEYVYAGPVQGYAQVALAYACKAAGKRATLFSAGRRVRHARTRMATDAGARLVECRPGYLSVVRSRARAYVAGRPHTVLLPFGLACPEMVQGIADLARSLPVSPKEVWSVAGSGTLSRGLQLAWPKATFYAVRVGAVPDVGRATLLNALERYEQPAMVRPPFPSCDNYDAKAWAFIKRYACPGALFWNVAP